MQTNPETNPAGNGIPTFDTSLLDPPHNEQGATATSVLKSDENEHTEMARSSSLLQRNASIPLPGLKSTVIDWARVDKLSGLICPCFPFITQLILVATTGSLLFGINTALLNTSLDYIASDFNWCDVPGFVDCNRSTWLKALTSTGVFLGAAAGAITGGRFVENGHRLVLLATLVIFLLGIVGSVVAQGFASLLFARLVVGYGVGVTSLVTPGYISEMAPKEFRGRYGVFHQLFLVVGQLIAVILGLAFQVLPERPDDGPEPSPEQNEFTLSIFNRVWWRVMLGLGLIPVLVALFLFGPVFTFETPQYYVRKHQYDVARELLQRIHAKDYDKADAALEEMKEQAGQGGLVKARGLLEIVLSPGYRRALWVGLGVSIFQQITGINAFIASSNRLFGEGGLSRMQVTGASIGLIGVNLLCTFIPLFLVDRLGRRTLFLVGSTGMALAVAPATIMYWIDWSAKQTSDMTQAWSIAGAYVFMVFFAIAAGPVTWLYLFEIFPMDMKSIGSAICVAANWLAGILMVFGAGLLDTKVAYTVFFSECFIVYAIQFSGCSVVYILFVFLFVRETKGRAMGDSPYLKNETPPIFSA